MAEGEASTAGLMRESRDSRRLSSSSSSGRRWKTVPVTVVLPDCSAFFMELREDCKGFDCLAKVRLCGGSAKLATDCSYGVLLRVGKKLATVADNFCTSSCVLAASFSILIYRWDFTETSIQ